MKTSADIERLWDAEQQAQTILAQADEKARQLRKEAADQIEQMTAQAEKDLQALRQRTDNETLATCDATAKAARDDVDAIYNDVSTRLDDRKRSAAQRVVEQLVKIP